MGMFCVLGILGDMEGSLLVRIFCDGCVSILCFCGWLDYF